MPPDDTLFRMFRFRGEVRERIPVCEAERLVEPAPPPPPPSTPSQMEVTEDSTCRRCASAAAYAAVFWSERYPTYPRERNEMETGYSE
ncbi:hypothetical protein MRX96_033509 [Rhipicephalus microplus]